MTAVYLDYNATAPIRPEALAAVRDALGIGGNPSSVHAAGRRARTVVETARADVGRMVGASPASVTFTSGGTEANALAISSAVASGISRIVVGATEHDAVRASAEATTGVEVVVWRVDARGVADLGWLTDNLTGPKTLVCLMSANNETGVIQPVAEAARMVRDADGWLHVDAVQSAGKHAIDFTTLGADTLALSAHKLGGPQGVGALVAGPRATLHRQMNGGGQERGLRAGTENVSGIAGFGAAAKASLEQLTLNRRVWRDALAETLEARGAVVLGEGADRLHQTLCVATPDFPAELQVMALDLAGVMISAGAACSSGKMKPSQVVSAMGRPDLASCAIRISGGWASTENDWVRCGEAWIEAHQRRSKRVMEYA
jgi:cysteine desulfurase